MPQKLIVFLTLIISVCLLTPNYAFASKEFITKYQTTYTVNPDVSVSVEQEISLTNRLANIYASQYQISLGTTRVRGFWARDDAGDLLPQVERKQNTTNIKVTFKQKVFGKGKTMHFYLGYISDDYAMKNGRVLEVGIPEMTEINQLEDYKVNLVIPCLFEKPAFILPKPAKVSQTANSRVYFFNKEELENESISATFGNFQVFNFNLKYHLKNTNNFSASTEIALPPDTPYQKVY